MKWITRAQPKTNRIACPWLIRPYMDCNAEIVYVPAGQVLEIAAAAGVVSFDAPGADYTHQSNPDGGGWCTFETLIAEFHLDNDDAALALLAAIVHAADIAADVHTDRLGPGLQAGRPVPGRPDGAARGRRPAGAHGDRPQPRR